MTVSTTLNKITYAGNGVTTVFPFAFATPAIPSDIQVFFTDVNGNITLLSASQYTLTINSTVAPDPTPTGGSVTYNPGGTPIPLGTFLTILRNLPVLQSVSLANQGTFYQQVTEQALDYSVMLAQQILEVQSRALVVSISDPIPNPIPAVAARAGLVLGFDSSGNPIAVSTAPAGTISSAMAPVVAAASLSAGRSALGLGSIATETIGLGLEDNGSGSLQTFYGATSDSTGQSVTSTFHTNVRVATGAITYTLPQTTTLFNGFGFFVHARTAAVTFAINAADSFDGAVSGASLVVPPGSRVFISTNGAGTWYANGILLHGFNAPLNLAIQASVTSSALTIALKDANNNDPSTASPVIFAVASISGGLTPRAITGPLSITVPNGATLGTVNGQANRIWVGVFDNTGTPVLAVYNSLNSTGPSLLPWDESTAINATAISAGSTSPQVWYGASSVTSKSFRVLGYVESTQPTAGAWTSAPSKVQLFGPGVKKPGDTVQSQFAQANNVNINLVSAANIIKYSAGCFNNTASGSTVYKRGGTTIFTYSAAGASAAVLFDILNTTATTNYSITGSNTTTSPLSLAEEIQI